MDFSDKTVLITGASRGIGLGIAEGFAKAGARLHVLADEERIFDVAPALGATPHLADITDTRAVTACLAQIPVLDVLINNAGLERLTPLDDASDETAAIFARILNVNVLGTYLVTRAALPKLPKGGRIISTSSVWGRVAEPFFGAYVASKHAVIGLTKCWARELGPRGINVNAVAPGWVRTESALRSLTHMAARGAVAEETLLASILAAQALPGLMEPADMAGIYMFLASPYAANITGQTIGADRGEAPC
jgi:NAD(P)-dependent dehydrogenase (short-subunit alcohol dehydrogenase family)